MTVVRFPWRPSCPDDAPDVGVCAPVLLGRLSPLDPAPLFEGGTSSARTFGDKGAVPKHCFGFEPYPGLFRVHGEFLVPTSGTVPGVGEAVRGVGVEARLSLELELEL